MTKLALSVCSLCGALLASCSNAPSGSSGDAGKEGSTGTGAGSLVGTWTLTTTPMGGSGVSTTLTIGQDSLSITSPDFAPRWRAHGAGASPT